MGLNEDLGDRENVGSAAVATQRARENRRSCNRHDDCTKAEEEFKAENGRAPGFNFHCHDEECEDCFGC